PGEPAGRERGEAGQHPLLVVVLIARGALLGDQGRDRAGHRDGGAHRDTPDTGAAGSSAHFDSRPREDFRETPAPWTDWCPRMPAICSTGVPPSKLVESNVQTLLNTSARRTDGCGVCPHRC